MNIRALLVKTFARETSEVRGGFAPVPAGTDLEQGLALLNQSEAWMEARNERQQHVGQGNALAAPAALTTRK